MTAILFAPADVELVLADMPTVAALLPDPAIEGKPSDAFPALRKTEREVYRWLAGTRYEHLADAVALLERVYAAGCSFDGLLATRSRAQFVGHSGELLVADDLIRRGYTVTAVPRTEQATPDLHVAGAGIDAAVEVYSPRELVAVDDWVEKAKDLVNQMDVPADYTSRVDTRIELEQRMPPARQPDSWEVADMLASTHDEVLASIAEDVEDHLRELRSFSNVYRHAATPLTTTVELDDVRASSEAGPDRFGTLGWAGFGGYSPGGSVREDRRPREAEGDQAASVRRRRGRTRARRQPHAHEDRRGPHAPGTHGRREDGARMPRAARVRTRRDCLRRSRPSERPRRAPDGRRRRRRPHARPGASDVRSQALTDDCDEAKTRENLARIRRGLAAPPPAGVAVPRWFLSLGAPLSSRDPSRARARDALSRRASRGASRKLVGVSKPGSRYAASRLAGETRRSATDLKGLCLAREGLAFTMDRSL